MPNIYNSETTSILSQLQNIASAVAYAVEGKNLDQVLERIAYISAELVNARYAALGVPDSEGGLKTFKVVGMTPEEIAGVDHLPEGRGLLGAIMQERKPIRLAHMADDHRSVGFCPGHPEMTSLLGVPIQVGQQLFGLIYLCDRLDGHPFTEQDQWLVETMASYAALAIAGAQLNEQQNRLNLLEERERIGMELHDGVIQSLYGLGMQLELARTNKQNLEPADIQHTINQLNQIIEDIRRYIMKLNTNGNKRKTIYESFEALVEGLNVPESLDVEIDAPHYKPPFTAATFEAICQIANEAISNAVRHAHATKIAISVSHDDRLFRCTITDNGQGFDPNVLPNTGLGLRNIQQRARMHNGQVQIDSSPGEGTHLTITVPIRML
jgi:signal transduction histidine kinase